MYRIVTVTKDGETEISRSQNHRLAKRKARWYAQRDPDTWFSKFLMYKDEDVIEEGAIISSRISWSKMNVRIRNDK